jgi:predicted unusual protein kinase regulating ubiquinone biosynthesis (AarF/ABC1/UbiB family)
MDDEANSLGQRMGRYARVGGAMGGLAARVVGEKFLGIPIERDAHAKSLRAALGGLKGPLMKVAQILSTIPGALPEEYAKELSALQADAPPMGWMFVKRRMAAELGADWEQRFASFEHEAAAAASLGQVHRAVSQDGKRLACKLQYPDMLGVVDADLRQLKLAMGLFESYDRAVSTSEVHSELSDRLREELDYVNEAHNIRLYRDMLATETKISVPDVFTDLSTKRLLTMSWLDGTPLLDYQDAPLEQRNRLAETMFRAWYVPFYYYGIIHGDPHPGNYSVRPDDGINLLDFGCVRIFPPSFVGGVIDLYRALDTGDTDLARRAYESWGFTDLTPELLEVLNIWADFLYGPLLDNRERRIGEIDHQGVYGRDLAEKVHKELRRLGGVQIPREFVFMDRAALGLGSVFLRLKSELNWHRLFNELIEGFDVNVLARRQADLLASGR